MKSAFAHIGYPMIVCAMTVGCNLPPPGSYVAAAQAQFDQGIENMRVIALTPLWEWEKESPPSCNSPTLAKARASVLNASTATGQHDWHSSNLDVNFKAGSWVLDVADAAKEHDCKDVARNLYDDVIETYIGSGYAALRDRARVGIDDLRAQS